MRHTSIQQVVGTIVIALALYAILFSGVRHFSNEQAEHMLADLSAHFADEAASRGQEAKLQYSNVDIRGFGYEKWARVSRLSLDLITQQWHGGTRLGISSENADLVPDMSSGERLSLRLPDTLNIIASSELLARVSPSAPLIYVFNGRSAGAPDSVKHILEIPGTLRISTPTAGQEMQLIFSHPAQAALTFLRPQHQLRAEFASPALELQTQGGVWSAGGAEMHYSSVQKGARMVESQGNIMLDKLAFASATPYTATAAWTMKEQRNISGATDSSELTIEHSLLTDGNMKIVANGTLNFDIDDAPYGEVVIEISNASEWLKSNWIAEDKHALAETLLNRIMGDEIQNRKQAIISIERAKNGEWKVGHMPLSELIDQGLLSIFIFSGKTHDDKTS